ncbi:putative aminopeptidase-2 [Linepithema humile]|uniref:putative aminopeptidase-2 n=1 Tax=Linepithema humile TaxID=83485 RepID=UPI00351F2BC8
MIMTPVTRADMHYIKVILFVSIGLTFATETIDDNYLDKLQLRNVYPTHYTLKLIVNIRSSYPTYIGLVHINIHILSPIQVLFLNAKHLKIYNSRAMLINDQGIIAVNNSYMIQEQILAISFQEKVPPGRYILRIKFQSTSKYNFYQSNLHNKTMTIGQNRSFILTQFGKIATQLLFPCWDDPAFKATFDISVKHSKEYKALSNMPLSRRYNSYTTMTWSQFDTTPIMSIHQLVIVLTPFSKIANPRETVFTWCKSDATSTIYFAHSIVEKVLKHLFRYTNVSSETRKIDQIVISDVPYSEAHWGLLVYRESDIIYDKNKDAISVKIQVANTVATQVARQLFGGLVTPKWRIHSWISESFALLFSRYVLDQMYEDWIEIFFTVVEDLHVSLLKDNGLMPPVLSEINNNFDILSLKSTSDVYRKGSVLLRMLQHIMGEETFQKGVIKYLKEYKNGLVTTDHLWFTMQTALEATSESKVDIKKVMDTWITQKGFPLVTVKRDYVTGETIISQLPYKSFEIVPNATSSKWWIPVTWTKQSYPAFDKTIPTSWLRPEDKTISITTNPKEWIIVNVQQSGYYRVHYDRTNWEKIANYLHYNDYSNIHVLNRAQIIDDICHIFKDRQTDWALFSLVTSYLSIEIDYIVWVPMLKCLDMLSIYFPLPESKNLQMHFASYFTNILNEIGYEEDPEDPNDDDLTRKARQNLAFYACTLGNPTCISAAAEKLRKHLADPTIYKILPWWENWTFCFGLKTEDPSIWDKVYQLYEKTKNETILNFLPCSEDSNNTITLLHRIENNVLIEAKQANIFNTIIKQHISDSKIFSHITDNIMALKPESMSLNDTFDTIITNIYSEDLLNNLYFRLMAFSNDFSVYETNRDKIEWQRMKIHALKSNFDKIFYNKTKRSLHNHEKTSNMEYMKLLLNVGLIFAVFCIKNSKSCENCYSADNVLPKHYTIRLIPNMETEATSTGNLIASFEIRRDTYNFSIDLLHLSINETMTYVRGLYNDKYVPKEYHYNNMKEMLTLIFEEELLKGSYDLIMNFTGNAYSTKDKGFYTKSYISNEGQRQMVAVTQSQDFTARQTFPCWDEPTLKATFDILIMHDKKYKVLSNMPEKQTSQMQRNMSDTDIIWTEFETTPKMSTHLVAAVVFDPVHISNTFTSKTVNIWCRPTLLTHMQLQFMHDVAKNVIKYLSDYTSFCNVPMINIVLLPDSLITKTVSSWALVVYRESDFVQKNEDIPGMKKRQVADLIAEHVIRHWFGNLITPSRWTWIWLRDGFVKFFKAYILDMIFEDWRTMDLLVVKDMHSSLYNDIGYTMTPVVSNDIRFQFSFLKYTLQYTSLAISAKASALLRMLQFITTNDYFPHDVFNEGIINYVQNNAYGSIDSEQVWHSIQHPFIEEYFKSVIQNNHTDEFAKLSIYFNSTVSHKTFRIKTVMDAYMKHIRYPLVTVKRDYITGKTIITQQYFSTTNVNQKWWLPLTYATQANPDFYKTYFIWLSPEVKNINITVDPNEWIIVNLQQYGYYRVNYDETNWQKIVDYLNSDEYIKIHVLNRVQLLDDAYSLVRYQRIKGSIFMNLTKYLSREKDYVVWYTMFRIFGLLSESFLLPESKNLKLHFSKILGSRLEKLGYEENPDDDDFTKLERLNATHWACYFGNTKCKSVANAKLLNYIDDPENYNILPYWQEWTLCAGLMTANTSTWQLAKDIYFQKLLDRRYEFLACAEKPAIILKYLDIWRISKNTTRENSDFDDIINFIIKKHGHNDEILNYISNHFETLIPRLSLLGTNIISRLILNVHSIAQLNKVENLANNVLASNPHVLAELRDTMEVRKSNLEFQKFFFTSRFSS